MRITIDHLSRDELSQQSWAFYVTDNWHGREGIAVVLDRYTVSKRLSTGEKLRAEGEWSRWGTAGFGGVMKMAKPPEVPEWVRARVVAKINEAILFVRQTDAPSFASPDEAPGME